MTYKLIKDYNMKKILKDLLLIIAILAIIVVIATSCKKQKIEPTAAAAVTTQTQTPVQTVPRQGTIFVVLDVDGTCVSRILIYSKYTGRTISFPANEKGNTLTLYETDVISYEISPKTITSYSLPYPGAPSTVKNQTTYYCKGTLIFNKVHQVPSGTVVGPYLK